MRLPNHIAIIPDGNRRWAKENNLEKREGYSYGLDPGLKVLKMAKKYNIPEITYYGFTMDNCKRPKDQQEAFKKACVDAVKIIEKEGNVSILVVGDFKSNNFPKELLGYTTRKNIGRPDIKVNFLVNYGWKWDLSGIYDSDCNGNIQESIHSNDISRIDLIIRWGNRRRLSGMLPVQTVYSDFYIIDNYWPYYKDSDFEDAINWYDKQDITLGG